MYSIAKLVTLITWRFSRYRHLSRPPCHHFMRYWRDRLFTCISKFPDFYFANDAFSKGTTFAKVTLSDNFRVCIASERLTLQFMMDLGLSGDQTLILLSLQQLLLRVPESFVFCLHNQEKVKGAICLLGSFLRTMSCQECFQRSIWDTEEFGGWFPLKLWFMLINYGYLMHVNYDDERAHSES